MRCAMLSAALLRCRSSRWRKKSRISGLRRNDPPSIVQFTPLRSTRSQVSWESSRTRIFQNQNGQGLGVIAVSRRFGGTVSHRATPPKRLRNAHPRVIFQLLLSSSGGVCASCRFGRRLTCAGGSACGFAKGTILKKPCLATIRPQWRVRSSNRGRSISISSIWTAQNPASPKTCRPCVRFCPR